VYKKTKNFGKVIGKINVSVITNGRTVAFFANRQNNRFFFH
jgi:hypothetical protein